MAPDYAQRRRVALAVAITAIAAPAAFLFDRGGDEPEQVVTTVVGSVVSESPAPSGTDPQRAQPEGTDPMGTAPAAYIEPSGTVAPDDPATIAIPRLPDAVEGRATFTRAITDVTSCQVKASLGAPFGGSITVTNLDNSHSVRCIFDVGGPQPDHEVVLHADAFSQIADLTDAPVPVQLTW
jgi:hypothetical protein